MDGSSYTSPFYDSRRTSDTSISTQSVNGIASDNSSMMSIKLPLDVSRPFQGDLKIVFLKKIFPGQKSVSHFGKKFIWSIYIWI